MEDKIVAQQFNSNKIYFEMMRDWHLTHNGIAIEPEMIQLITNKCKPGCRVLEAGSGEGSITRWFAKHYPETRFTGVDISQIGVVMSRENCPSNADFQIADLKKLPFSNEYVDFIYSQSALEHVVGWENALRELYRILRKNGSILIRVGNGGTAGQHLPNALLHYIFHRTRVHKLSPTFKLNNGDYKAHMTNFDVQEIPSNVLLRELKQIGFHIDFFSTRIHTFRKDSWSIKNLLMNVLSVLNFWPFNHLGPTIIVLAQKK